MTETNRSQRFKSKYLAVGGALVIGAASFGIIGMTQQPTPKPSPSVPERLVTVDGATLDKIFLDQRNVVYLQTIDLHKMQIDQLMGKVDRQVSGNKGLYYPSNNRDSSPFFKRLTVAAIRKAYLKQHPTVVFSIINASFFEQYRDSTQLSFPIKVNGLLMTAGSSPYGPIPTPKHPYYRSIKLKALTWDDNKAKISTYNPKTGYPLNQSKVKNGLVSYAYQDHPAYVLSKDPVNHYHVIGVLDGKVNRLLIATSNRSTLAQAAEVLRQRGVKGDIMTIDGGISTYLSSIKTGDLILPRIAEGERVPALPHYLGIRSKGKE